ncbi:MAG: glycolate oxidase subunit GlcE [Granulosicoccaceae bacterium]
MNTNDDTAALQQAVQQACDTSSAINIQGGGSKSFLGKGGAVSTVSTLNHTGIVNYEPTELVVSVRAGTLLSDLTKELAANGQLLPFEPPQHDGATIGGVLACGLSGPTRPFTGSARDYVLGVRMINGQAQHLRFGGDVMKNVAGYDVSRLQIGAYGSLGLLLDASMKVLPVPQYELTLVSTRASTDDYSYIGGLARRALPVTAAAMQGNIQYIRLSGTEIAVKSAAKQLEGDIDSDANAFWPGLRDQSLEFFNTSKTLWRISVAEYAPVLPLSGDWLYDWSGAQRWLCSDEAPEAIFAAAAAVGGHATRYGTDDTALRFQPLTGTAQRLQKRLRDSFDADRLFNPGQFHPEFDSDQEQKQEKTSS